MIDAEQLCALSGLTDMRHRQLAKGGYFPPPFRARYQFAATIQGLFRYYRERVNRRAEAQQFDEQKLRLMKEQADETALRNEKTRGLLVETEEVYKWAEAIFVGLRQGILASGLSDAEKDEILKGLRGLKVRNLPMGDK